MYNQLYEKKYKICLLITIGIDDISISTSKILNLIYETPDITTQRLSNDVGINMAVVNKHLTDKGYIQRVAKDGTWRLVITPSV